MSRRTKELILNPGGDELMARLQVFDDGRNARWEGILRLEETDDWVPVQLGKEDDELGNWLNLDAAYETIERLGEETAEAIVKEALSSMDAGVYEGVVRGVHWRLQAREPGSLWYQHGREQ